ncbi:MAG TPA: thiamine diphosphokinase [Spirochaetia bacterium]|nr:thiamine diphosphokinase [Spirochaetia bacterium]
MAEPPRGVLFIGGEGPPEGVIGRLVADSDMVVAADSGYDLARSAGVEPDLLVGDMDSIADFAGAMRRLQGRVERYERQKDETDTEIGLRILHERGFRDITLVGGGGGRMDHLLGIVVLFEREIRPKRWITRGESVVHIEREEIFDNMKGVLCSFFPVGPGMATMRTTGLRWPLDGLSWKHGDAGVSNYGLEDRVTVTMLSGQLIMVQSLMETGNV